MRGYFLIALFSLLAAQACAEEPAAGCPTGLSPCGDALCTNLSKDAANCGACGKTCASGQACSGGVCGVPCSFDKPDRCGNTCTDLRLDENNCGACGNVCSTDEGGFGSCFNGACQ